MSANIIGFPKQELGYWTCNCGCSTHKVRSDGEIECGSCGASAQGIGYWRKPHPDETPRERTDDDATAFTSIDADPAFSRQRHAQRVRAGEFIIALGIRKDGGLSTCREHDGVATDDQRAWLRRRLDEAYDLILGNSKP